MPSTSRRTRARRSGRSVRGSHRAPAPRLFKLGAAAAALSRNGADCGLTQDVVLTYPPLGDWQGRTVTLGCWVRATVASRAFLRIDDGVGTTDSAFHSGGSTWEYLT